MEISYEKLKPREEIFNSLVLDAILGDSTGLHSLYLTRRRCLYLGTLGESGLTLLLRMKEQKPGYHSTATSLIRRVRCTITDLLQTECGSVLRTSDGDAELNNESVVDRYIVAFIKAMIAYLGSRLTLEHLVIGDMPDECAFRGAQLQNYDYVALAAVWLGNEDFLRTLLDHGKVKETSEFFLIALHVNAAGGHAQMFQFLAKRGNPPLKLAGETQSQVLWTAASKGNLDVLRLFLDSGFDVDSFNGSQGTALHAAANEVDTHIAQLLLESGADPNFRGRLGRTPLWIVATRSNSRGKAEKSLDLMKILLQYGADVNEGPYGQPAALYSAAQKGNIAAVSLLLEAGADPNPLHPPDHRPLIGAIDTGDIAIVRLLLDHGSEVDSPKRGNNYYTPIRHAVRSGKESILDLLVERMANPNYVSDQAGPLLEDAVFSECPNMIKKLISLGVNIHAHESVLVNRVQWGWDVKFLHLLYREGLPIANPLLKVAVIKGNSQLVEILLRDLSLDPASTDDRETLESLLMEAFRCGRESVASLLVDAGANLRTISLQDLNFSNGVSWQLKLLKVMEEGHQTVPNIDPFVKSDLDCSEVGIFYVAMAACEMEKVDQAWAYAYAMGPDAVELLRFSFSNLGEVKEKRVQAEPLMQAIHHGDLALVELLMPWYIRKGVRIRMHKAIKKAMKSGSQIMVKYVLDSFQSRYDRQIGSQFHEWKRCLERYMCDVLDHFPTAQQFERYWLEWTFPRRTGEDRCYAENAARLLKAALDSESDIQVRFILRSEMIKQDMLFTPETTGAGGLFDPEVIATAIVTGNIFVLKKYVAAGVDFGTRITGEPFLCRNFSWSPILRDFPRPREWTPLTLASFIGQGEMVKYLLAVGTNPKLAHEELSKPVPDCTNRSLVKLVMNTPEPMEA